MDAPKRTMVKLDFFNQRAECNTLYLGGKLICVCSPNFRA